MDQIQLSFEYDPILFLREEFLEDNFWLKAILQDPKDRPLALTQKTVHFRHESFYCPILHAWP